MLLKVVKGMWGVKYIATVQYTIGSRYIKGKKKWCKELACHGFKVRTHVNKLALVIGGNSEVKITLETKIGHHFSGFSLRFVYLFRDQV